MALQKLLTTRLADVPAPPGLDRLVFIDGRDIVLDVRYPYRVPLDRCKTHADLLGWALRLSPKTWMTPGLLHRFTALALEHHGLPYPSP
ncbi:MAG TPA: hypothetical protein VFA75_08180 [Nevskia sp.]|nr:hypothetical protein [Nevskia sp.]